MECWLADGSCGASIDCWLVWFGLGFGVGGGVGVSDRWWLEDGVSFRVDNIRDHGHAHGSRCSEFNNYLGENPGGILGTAQANPCCWLTPIGS